MLDKVDKYLCSRYVNLFLLVIIVILLVKRRYSKFEHMSNVDVDVEALRNLSSMYNKGKLKVTELEVTGNIKGKKLEVTGNITGEGKLKIKKSAEIGPAYIGPYGTNTNHAEFSHVENRTDTTYGLLHVNNGRVYINSNGKGSIYMQHNNNNKSII